MMVVIVNSALGCLHHVNVGSAANVSEVYAASIFRTYPEETGGIYLKNVCNIAHIHCVNTQDLN
jgi:hypothetical protein